MGSQAGMTSQLSLLLAARAATGLFTQTQAVDTSGPDSYFDAPPKGAADDGARVFRVPTRFAFSADEAGSTGSTPPPPPGAGSNDDGSGDAGVGFKLRPAPTLRVSEVERLFSVKQMDSVETLKRSIALDLAEIKRDAEIKRRDVDQLDYLRDVAKTLDEYVRSGRHLEPKAMVEALAFISSAADGFTEFITPKSVDGKAGADASTVLMKHLTSSADYLERFILEKDTMDRETAEWLARIYFVAAVKGSGCDALSTRLLLGINSPAYRAHVGRTILQLIDVKERFERLGKSDDMHDVMRALTAVTVHHGFTPNTQKNAFDSVVSFLRSDIEAIYKSPVDKRSYGKKTFMRNLRYVIDGNRRFGPSILFNCAEIFFEMEDKAKERDFTKWGANDNLLSSKLAGI